MNKFERQLKEYIIFLMDRRCRIWNTMLDNLRFMGESVGGNGEFERYERRVDAGMLLLKELDLQIDKLREILE